MKPDAMLRKDRTNARGTSMEHRHFAFIAGVIHDMPQNSAAFGERRAIAIMWADALAGTNPRFDYQRFLAACGD